MERFKRDMVVLSLMLENIVKENVPFAGTYEGKLDLKGRIIIPSDIMDILKRRQRRKDCSKIILYQSVCNIYPKEKFLPYIILKDEINDKEASQFFLSEFTSHNRYTIKEKISKLACIERGSNIIIESKLDHIKIYDNDTYITLKGNDQIIL